MSRLFGRTNDGAARSWFIRFADSAMGTWISRCDY